MNGPDQDVVSFGEDEVDRADVIFDCVAFPVETPLIKLAKEKGKRTIDGGEVAALQAAEQFHLYTGVLPTNEQIIAAEEFSK